MPQAYIENPEGIYIDEPSASSLAGRCAAYAARCVTAVTRCAACAARCAAAPRETPISHLRCQLLHPKGGEAFWLAMLPILNATGRKETNSLPLDGGAEPSARSARSSEAEARVEQGAEGSE